MDWLSSVQKKAQEAVNSVVNSEAAGKARQLAQQATQQATAIAKEATLKAQEVAKEALGEAEKSLSTLRQGNKSAVSDPQQCGITPELEQFVRSLTYSTFSDYPLDSLDIPAEPAAQKLNSWQETHARLVLQQVPQLQDLRFVLCPKRMDEYTFWTIYFTLCKRYLPTQSHTEEQQPAEAAGASSSSVHSSQAPAAAGLPLSSSAQNLAQESEAGATSSAAAPSREMEQPAESAAAGSLGAAPGAAAASDGDDDELAELANDPELDAYLQDALQLDGDAGAVESGDDGDGDGSDLDDYINKLDAEVSTK